MATSWNRTQIRENCRYCGKDNHTSLMCWSKPRKPFRKIGPVTHKWLDTRKEWVKNNPPDYRGYWFCFYCTRPLTYEELTLDHLHPRSTHPELRYDHNNLVPSCYPCNIAKGSKDIDSFSH